MSNMTLIEKAKAFASDPAEFFHRSFTEMHSIDPVELRELQLAALQYRFSSLRNTIPALKKLADRQNIDSFSKVEDVLPLLFDHKTYKSYPPSFLENNQFDQLTRWLGKLTTHDLSHVDASGCEGIDDWIQLLEKETPIRVVNSGGTTGLLSFLPRSLDEWMLFGKNNQVNYFQCFGDPVPEPFMPGISAVFPNFRFGANAMVRQNDYVVKLVTGSEDKLYTLYPGRISSDVLYLAARIRAAKARGSLDEFKISPRMLAKQKEHEALQAQMHADMEKFFEKITRNLMGQRVYMMAPWTFYYDMAQAGLKRGLEQIFAPDSVIATGGGNKGVEPPKDWQEVTLKFLGVPKFKWVYGMSEIATTYPLCDHNHYHVSPSNIPFILDPDTSKPLPRTGTVTGRFAVFELLYNSHWGGFISGDEVTMHWDGGCPCGAKSAYIENKVVRYSEKRGGDDKINCASTPDAYQEAMDYLNKQDQVSA